MPYSSGTSTAAGSIKAFALWCHGDNTLVTWGGAEFGGDSSAVQDQLRGVQQIQATLCAFAAILADGSVVTWGKQRFGGDSSAVQDQLRGVQQIQATPVAFAAILEDGLVVSWGDHEFGGDSSLVQDQLRGVQHVQGDVWGICCDFGRWFSRYLGRSKVWW